MSGRTLNRYRDILGTPVEVRIALRERKLSLVVAEKIAALDLAAQAGIVRRLRAGEDAGLVVAEMVDSPARLATIDAVLDRLSRVTGQASEDLDAYKENLQKETNSQRTLRAARELLIDQTAPPKPEDPAGAKENAALARQLGSPRE